jgi:hypothetical protein
MGKKRESKAERRNNMKVIMRTRKEMIFPSPPTAHGIFVMFTEGILNVHPKKKSGD